jgi:hypothetical protein
MGLTLKKEKCLFLKENIEFLGYKLNKCGLMPNSLDNKLASLYDLLKKKM